MMGRGGPRGRTTGESTADLVPIDLGRTRPAPAPRARPSSRLAIAVAAAIALVGGLVFAGHSGDTPGPGHFGDTPGPGHFGGGANPGGGQESVPPGWERLDLGPLVPRLGHMAVWTGAKLVVIGGFPESQGATWNPENGLWMPIALSPMAERTGAAVAWTGREVLLWGGRGPGGSLSTGGAYDPGTDRWRALPSSPLGPDVPLAGVWTGRELVVAGSTRDQLDRASTDALAYDPATDRWRSLDPLPLALHDATATWTGREVVVFGSLRQAEGLPPAAGGAAFDPSAGRWRRLAPPPLTGRSVTAAWTGAELVSWDSDLRAAAWEPAADRWRALPGLPLRREECSPLGVAVGPLVYAEHCGQGALYDPATRSWTAVPHPRWLWGEPMWTGEELLFWVPDRFGAFEPGAWSYRPPSPARLRARSIPVVTVRPMGGVPPYRIRRLPSY